jgi:hypothetical protein
MGEKGKVLEVGEGKERRVNSTRPLICHESDCLIRSGFGHPKAILTF